MANIEGTAGSVFDGLNAGTQLAKSILIRPKNPPVGIGGFIFDIQDENRLELQSDITDHYVEDNTAIQDQWALKPELISVDAYVGELGNKPQGIFSLIAPFINKLPLLGQFAPKLTAGALQIYNKVQRYAGLISKGISQAKDIYGFFKGKSGLDQKKNKQTQAVLYFYNIWKSRQLVSVETPWGVWNNAAILSCVFTQDKDTNLITKFSITFKQIRIAGEVKTTKGKLAGRLDLQKSPIVENGNAGKTQVPAAQKESVLHSMKEKVVGFFK